jgi:hypothetical protein
MHYHHKTRISQQHQLLQIMHGGIFYDSNDGYDVEFGVLSCQQQAFTEELTMRMNRLDANSWRQ